MNGSPICTEGRFSRVVLAELCAREHRGAADPVPPGRRAVEHDERACLRRLRAREPLDRKQPDAHRVDEAVGGVRVVEDDLAAHVGDAHAVAIMADTADRTREVVVRGAEAQPVEQRDRSRAHRGDVAQDPADAGRRALERLDRGGMVVALDLERDGEAVAEVEDARVLARPLEHARAVARQPSQEERRVLVAAVLRPEEREDRELEVVRLPPEQREDPVELPVRQAELAMERRLSDGAQVTHSSPRRGRASTAPSAARHRVASVATVSRRDLGLLLLLSAIWGSSFLFIKLGVDELEPAVVVLGRTVVGAVILLPLLAGRGWPRRLRGAWQPLVVLGALNNALPFWLLGVRRDAHRLGAHRRDPGGGADLHGAPRARLDPEQAVRGLRLVGVGVGFLGVALLVGVPRRRGSWSAPSP